jgi:putative SbcD/Mre11-related phosphoesterase
MKPLFVTGEPALVLDRTLFLADIHLGIEYEYRQSGLNMPSQTGKLLDRITSLLKRTKTKRLVLIGDIKHKVPGTSFQEERELPAFLSRLAERAELHIVPGNHDGKIAELMPKCVELHHMAGDMIGKYVYASHGHTWPEQSFLGAKYLLVSHSHPQFEFRDRLGYRWGERVWIRTSLDIKKIGEKYKGAKLKEGAGAPSGHGLPELIVMPAFNPLSGGLPFNRKKPLERKIGGETAKFSPERSPILKSARMKTAKVYMLDGTYLGELGKIA